MPADLDLTQPHAIHIVGVGGAGMSAIATVLARMGHRVSGSDLRESRALERLGLLDVTTHVGHAAGAPRRGSDDLGADPVSLNRLDHGPQLHVA